MWLLLGLHAVLVRNQLWLPFSYIVITLGVRLIFDKACMHIR
jgi:hypothetical protein